MCVCVHAYVCLCVVISQPPTLPPFSCCEGGGGRGPSAQRPVSSRSPSSSPLSARQLGSGLCRTKGCGGLTFTLHPLTPPLPSLLPQRFICKRSVTRLFFPFICPRLARLLCHVSSSSPGTGQAIQGHVRPQQTRPGRQQGSGEGGEPVFGCSFFIWGQAAMVTWCFEDGLASYTGVSFTLTNVCFH